MKYIDLIQDYYVLNPISFVGKTIFVCRNKTTLAYDFFARNYGNLKRVNSSIFEQLKNIYHESTNNYVAIYVPKSLTPLQKKRLVAVHNTCKKIIEENIEHLPYDLQTKILEKLDSVSYTFKHDSDSLIFATYLFGEHTININFNMGQSASTDVSNILHELLHACSSSKNSTGFLIETPLDEKSNEYFRVNEFINEAYTEILRERFVAKHPDFNYSNRNISLYSPVKNLLKALIKQMDTTQLDIAYFENNGKKMLDIFAKELHIENMEELIKLSLLFDASFDSLKYAYGKGENLITACGPHIHSIVNEICYLNLNKLDKEDKNFNDIKFSDIFTPITQKSFVDASYNAIVNTSGNYFNYLKREFSNKKVKYSNKITTNEYLTKYVSEFLDYLQKGEPLPDSFPEELKSPELFNMAISKKLINTQNNKIISPDYNKLLAVLFDQNNNYLPFNEDVQVKIFATIIQNKRLPKRFGKYLPKESFAKLLNTNIYSFVTLCKNDILSVYEVMDKLTTQHKTSKDFYLNLIKETANDENRAYYYTNYLKTLDSASLIKVADGAFYSAIKKYSNLNDKELLEIHKILYPNMHKNNEINL